MILYIYIVGLPISLNIEKLNQIQGGKGVLGPSEQIFIFGFLCYSLQFENLNYKVNSPYKYFDH